ncbi:MAG: gephyrin-like molybdotransferase Glp [Thiotrichales bacterium]
MNTTDQPTVSQPDDAQDPAALTLADALARIDAILEPVRDGEWINVEHALGRVLATAVPAPFDVPPFRNSAMDGYALRSSDLAATREFNVIGRATAGHPYEGQVRTGECVRIMTGAVVPDECDMVVMQERARVTHQGVEIPASACPGQNIRNPGDDMARGARILLAGRKLNAADVGLLASLGLAQIEVIRPLRVSVFSTGDELVSLGSPLRTGQIYDSNRYTFRALLQRIGIHAIDLGVLPDDPTVLRHALAEAAATSDAILTSGGVSVGEADFVKSVLEQLGHIEFCKLAIKPGKPLAFGKIGQSLFFGLPGNPVSLMVTFLLIVRRTLEQLAGGHPSDILKLTAKARHALSKDRGRQEYQRGIFTQDPAGMIQVETTGLQGSHVLSSMSNANCLIVLPWDCEQVAAGESVTIIPLALLL